MDIDKAAKYLIVAWIKNWNTFRKTLAHTNPATVAVSDRFHRIHNHD